MPKIPLCHLAFVNKIIILNNSQGNINQTILYSILNSNARNSKQEPLQSIMSCIY